MWRPHNFSLLQSGIALHMVWAVGDYAMDGGGCTVSPPIFRRASSTWTLFRGQGASSESFLEREPEKEGEGDGKQCASMLRVQHMGWLCIWHIVGVLQQILVSVGQPWCQPEVFSDMRRV